VRTYKIQKYEHILMAEHCIVEISIYRAVLFDMDGVISDTMPLHYESWRRAFETFGVTVDKMDVYLHEGMTSHKMAEKIAEAKGKDLTQEQLSGIIENKSSFFRQLALEKAKAYDGVAVTLRMLRNNGLKTALVTGSRRDAADEVLKKIGLRDMFDVIVCAEDVKQGKPSPEPYESAIKKLGIDRLNCIVVENAPLGIESAKAAKVDYVIAVATSLPESYLSEADDIMSSITDLEQCLAQRFKARPGRAIV
jgi:beta-phosphoglucomutase